MYDAISTLHSDLRLMQRSNREKTLTELWEEGEPANLKYESYDLMRYHVDSGLAILKKNGVVVTILKVHDHQVTYNG